LIMTLYHIYIFLLSTDKFTHLYITSLTRSAR